MAKVVNCESRKAIEPCNKCNQCKAVISGSSLDVIELDAASNRGIDDIRSLREKVMLAPSSAAKKVYIIDEAHMLTTEASNAFLKTLEEPPDHVLFILATTNPEKLPETVRSRLTNVVFRKANSDEIARQLTRVMKGEKIKAADSAIEEIAKASDGSFRDAVKIVEQLSLSTKYIKKSAVEEYLDQNKAQTPDLLIEHLGKGDVKAALTEVENLVAGGLVVKSFIDKLLERLKEALLVRAGLEGQALPAFAKDELIFLIELLMIARNEVSNSPLPQLPLEIAVVKFCDQKPKEEPKENLKEIGGDVWTKILSGAKEKDTKVEALLRAARPLGFDGKTLKLGVYYQFHKERLEVNAIRQTLEDIVAEILGGPVRVSYVLLSRPGNGSIIN
ncbi:DNA polymerase III, subunit gamma and tau [Candidatus Woesebacteria bacterium RIFCSPHIGHO2_01_FULL_44_10]|nr:MAG: DNA polymerase III, subunit gamma and tau [Candidatus Woesebacteria bacterium RIFCSPHIGHO2_01_FULL_44_10]